MKRNLYRNLLWIVFLAGAMACGGEKKKSEKEIGKSEAQSSLISVDTLVLKKRTFQKQIVCNGKLRAVLKSELSFDGTGVITGINGRNGDYVKGLYWPRSIIKRRRWNWRKVFGPWRRPISICRTN